MKNCATLGALCMVAALVMSPAALAAQSDSLLIREDGVGRVRMGMSIDSLYRVVGRERTRLIDRFREGLFDPALEIRFGSPRSTPSLVAEVLFSACGARVGRIEVYDPRYHTASGLHVGSTLADVQRQHPVKISKEEGLRAYSAALPVTFELAHTRPDAQVLAITLYRVEPQVACGSG
jgi:hypothetical protein